MSKMNITDEEWKEIYAEIHQQEEWRKIQVDIMRKDAMMQDPNYRGQPME